VEAVHGCDYQYYTTAPFGFVESNTESEAPYTTIKLELTKRRMRNGEMTTSSCGNEQKCVIDVSGSAGIQLCTKGVFIQEIFYPSIQVFQGLITQ
jgi:hypothetical protein